MLAVDPKYQPGLEVVPFDSAPQAVVPQHEGLLPAQAEGYASYPPVYWQPTDNGATPEELDRHESEKVLTAKPTPRPRTRKHRWVVLIVVCLAVIAAVAGAVAGSLTKRSSASTPTPTGSSNATSSDARMTGSQGSPTSVTQGLAPTAISWGYPHLEIIATTNNYTDSVYRKYRNSNASATSDFLPAGTDMELVGGGISTNLTPTVALSHRLTGDGNVTSLHISSWSGRSGYRKSHGDDENWSGGDSNTWVRFSSDFEFESSPAQVAYSADSDTMKTFVLSQGDNGLSVFYFQYHQADDWSDPIQIQNGPDMQQWSTPAVVAWNGDDTRLDVFVVSRASNHLNHLMHTYKDSESDWSSYQDLEGYLTVPPVVVSRTPGTLDVFARGGDGGLWHLAFANDTWGGWASISGDTVIQGQPDAISMSENSIDVFAWGEDGAMLRRTYNATANSWEPTDGFNTPIDNKLAGPPKTMTDGTGAIHVFAYSDDSKLLWTTLWPNETASEQGVVVTLADVPSII